MIIILIKTMATMVGDQKRSDRNKRKIDSISTLANDLISLANNKLYTPTVLRDIYRVVYQKLSQFFVVTTYDSPGKHRTRFNPNEQDKYSLPFYERNISENFLFHYITFHVSRILFHGRWYEKLLSIVEHSVKLSLLRVGRCSSSKG